MKFKCTKNVVFLIAKYVAPYVWNLVQKYSETTQGDAFPAIEGEKLVFSDNDEGFAEVKLGFAFPYFGKEYTSVWVNTNGSIAFDSTPASVFDEKGLEAYRAIALLATDLMLDPTAGDAVFYSGDQESATFRWKASMFDKPAMKVDVAAKIYSSGQIEFFYGTSSMSGYRSAIGISAGDGINLSLSQLSGQLTMPQNVGIRWEAPSFPVGMNLSKEGVFSGTPRLAGQDYELTFQAMDSNKVYQRKNLRFSVASNGR